MGLTWDKDTIDQRVLDRLVDGELSDEQERALMARLDESPDGWRRCALAFLESRCWQQAAATVSEACPGELQPTVAGRPHTGGSTRLWGWALVMAASFLVALGIGTYLPRPGGQGFFTTDTLPAAPSAGAGSALAQVEGSTTPSSSGGMGLAGDLYLGDLKLVSDAGSEIDVPVFNWNQQVAEELMYRSQPLSPDVVRRLKRHHVRSSRSYMPVQLQDGRRIVLPVQEVDITPVGGMTY